MNFWGVQAHNDDHQVEVRRCSMIVTSQVASSAGAQKNNGSISVRTCSEGFYPFLRSDFLDQVDMFHVFHPISHYIFIFISNIAVP